MTDFTMSRLQILHSAEVFGAGKALTAFAFALLFAIAPAGEAGAKSKSGSAVTRYSDGVVVRKNPDGSIETVDANASPPVAAKRRGRQAGSASPRRSYPEVVVRRHPDGTIETFDAQAVPVARSVRSAAHKGKAAPSSTTRMSDVVVKRHADGTIETFDAGTTATASHSKRKR